ncbi:uncharacterized protein RSE6_13516 [Rhynchosporium secalis]|uniref:Uncharacterized protein n=1 Tax=Rhynchosporium secalis TaxID=38038 RepID=A0A1E1MT27_RHYSE|nr:uncharacterized protein RSE6_13516 [Rhynchosporium secalis]
MSSFSSEELRLLDLVLGKSIELDKAAAADLLGCTANAARQRWTALRGKIRTAAGGEAKAAGGTRGIAKKIVKRKGAKEDSEEGEGTEQAVTKIKKPRKPAVKKEKKPDVKEESEERDEDDDGSDGDEMDDA